MFIIHLKYYCIIWLIIECYGHVFDTNGPFINVLRSLMKYIWSIYRLYGCNIFEILLYYIVNNRVIWSYIGYIWSI